MSTIRPVKVLALSLLCWSLASAAGHAEETNELKTINFPILYFSERLAGGIGSRPEFILQLPLAYDRKDAGDSGLLLPAVEIDTLGFTSKGDYWTSTNGFIKFYYVPGELKTRRHIVLPYVTMYRIMVVNYRDAAGSEQNVSTNDWLVPGIQYAGDLAGPLTVHADAELFQYSHFDSGRLRAGFSYDLSLAFTVSIRYERLAWDIRRVEDGTDVGAKGRSDAVWLRGIYRTKRDGKLKGLIVAVSGGYEEIVNRGRSALVAPGDVDNKGYAVEVAVAGGLLAW